MSKSELYRETLLGLAEWEPYLEAESGLPGPRGNLELLYVVAELATEAQIERLLANGPDTAPTNTPQEFLAACGTVALGRLLAEGKDVLPRLKELANDPRWRVREGVAMALQRLGDADLERMVQVVTSWKDGTLLEQRAAIAGICEPRLLKQPFVALAALDVLDAVTTHLTEGTERKRDDFVALRKALGYCWSVAVAALPEEGLGRFHAWAESQDKDVAWVVRENWKKNRMKRVISG